jgi:hypothetical protein
MLTADASFASKVLWPKGLCFNQVIGFKPLSHQSFSAD